MSSFLNKIKERVEEIKEICDFAKFINSLFFSKRELQLKVAEKKKTSEILNEISQLLYQTESSIKDKYRDSLSKRENKILEDLFTIFQKIVKTINQLYEYELIATTFNILRKEAKQELARKEEEYRSKISKLKSDVYKKYNKIFDILKNKIDRLEFGEIRILEEYELGKGYYQIDLQIGNSTYTIRLKENERRELRNNYKKYNEEVRKVKNKEKEEKRRFEEYKRETEEILNLIDDAKKRIYKENKQNLYEIINYLNKLLDLNQLRS